METISWFFFDLLFLGYVEDSHSGESFQLPGGLSWSIYVEVGVPCPSVLCVIANLYTKCGLLPLHFYADFSG